MSVEKPHRQDFAPTCGGVGCLEPEACLNSGFCLFDEPKRIMLKISKNGAAEKSEDKSCLHCMTLDFIDEFLAKHPRPAPYVALRTAQALAFVVVSCAIHDECDIQSVLDQVHETLDDVVESLVERTNTNA